MNVVRLTVFGAIVTGTTIAALAACSSSSTTTGTDAGSSSKSSSGSKSGSTSGSKSGTSTSGNSNSKSESSSSSSSSAVNTCTITPGTYTVMNTHAGDGGAGCPPPNSVITYPAPPSDAGPAPDAGCTITTSAATCTQTTSCDTVAATYVSKLNETETVTGGLVSGTIADLVTSPDGGSVYSNCSYSFQWVAGTGSGSGS